MPRPTLTDLASYKTARQAGKIIGLTESQTLRWVKAGIFPPPTVTKRNGLRLFDDAWIVKARAKMTEVRQ